MQITRRFKYKSAKVVPVPRLHVELQGIVRAKLHTDSNAWDDRAINDKFDSEVSYVLNEQLETDQMLFGRLLSFRRGHAQEICRLTLGTNTMPIETRVAERPEMAFVQSQLYFGLQGNHVILMHSHDQRPETFEWWLNEWLSNELGEARIHLGDIIPLTTRDVLREARSIKVEPIATYQGAVRFDVTQPRVWRSVRAKLAQVLDKLSPGSSPPPRAFRRLATTALDLIATGVAEQIETRRYETADRLLRPLAQFVHNSRGMDFRIRYDDRHVIEGKDLKLSAVLSLDCDRGCLTLEEVATKMATWLSRLRSTRQISYGPR